MRSSAAVFFTTAAQHFAKWFGPSLVPHSTFDLIKPQSFPPTPFFILHQRTFWAFSQPFFSSFLFFSSLLVDSEAACLSFNYFVCYNTAVVESAWV